MLSQSQSTLYKSGTAPKPPFRIDFQIETHTLTEKDSGFSSHATHAANQRSKHDFLCSYYLISNTVRLCQEQAEKSIVASINYTIKISNETTSLTFRDINDFHHFLTQHNFLPTAQDGNLTFNTKEDGEWKQKRLEEFPVFHMYLEQNPHPRSGSSTPHPPM